MKNYIFRVLLDVLSGAPNSFLSGAKLRLLNMVGANVAKESYFDLGVKIRFPRNLTVGKGVYVGQDCSLVCFGAVTLGDYAQLANNICIVSGTHDVVSREAMGNISIVIGRYCWIGAGVKIVGNVVVGEGCVIGAGAVVVGDLPAWTVCVGVPARPIKKIEQPTQITSGGGLVKIN